MITQAPKQSRRQASKLSESRRLGPQVAKKPFAFKKEAEDDFHSDRLDDTSTEKTQRCYKSGISCFDLAQVDQNQDDLLSADNFIQDRGEPMFKSTDRGPDPLSEYDYTFNNVVIRNNEPDSGSLTNRSSGFGKPLEGGQKSSESRMRTIKTTSLPWLQKAKSGDSFLKQARSWKPKEESCPSTIPTSLAELEQSTEKNLKQSTMRFQKLFEEERSRVKEFQIMNELAESTPIIEGDRFINFRGSDSPDIAQKYSTKVELFTVDHEMEDAERKKNQLVSTGVEHELQEQENENKKTFLTLLQNQVLQIDNEDLLHEMRDNDENHFKPSLYSEMQKKADQGHLSQDGTPDNTNYLSSGAFSYTSPPEKLMLSDQTNEQAISPFNSKFTVLKFNSANKNKILKKKLGGSSNKSKLNPRSGKKMKPYFKMPSMFEASQSVQNPAIIKPPSSLLDLKLDNDILGKGIFRQDERQDTEVYEDKISLEVDERPVLGNSTNTSFSQAIDFYHRSAEGKQVLPSKSANKENPFGAESRNKMLASVPKPSTSDFTAFEEPLPMFKQNPFQGIADFEENTILPPKKARKIPKIPFKVLDAPELRDDFYLNVVDWSDSNNLAVALSQAVYIWSAQTSQVMKVHDYCEQEDMVASVCFSRLGGQHLAIGTHTGAVDVWDTETGKHIRRLEGHKPQNGRISALSWSNSHILSSGAKDKQILNRDLRVKEHFISRFEGHRQEIVGLKWSFDDKYLASGGNDNKLMIWNGQAHQTNLSEPLFKFSSHQAAVKALAWSPHQSSLLASGGGSADRCIKMWNTQQGIELQSVDTGSQVCNLMFSKSTNEIVSTHGFSDNAVAIWKYPSMKRIATLTGHSYRVLYLAMSPDSETIVTGAGDETLRFWKAFPRIGGGKSKANETLGFFGRGKVKKSGLEPSTSALEGKRLAIR